MEIVGGALAFIFKNKAVDIISDVLEDVYILGYQDDEDAVIDHFQENVSKYVGKLGESN